MPKDTTVDSGNCYWIFGIIKFLFKSFSNVIYLIYFFVKKKSDPGQFGSFLVAFLVEQINIVRWTIMPNVLFPFNLEFILVYVRVVNHKIRFSKTCVL